jgi:SAM-dependent methyltransferase
MGVHFGQGGQLTEPIANVEMANAWDGDEGAQWTRFVDEYDDSMRSIWARFLETDPIAPADRVLDIGCGCGQSTRDAARLARDGSALGIDLSESMLVEARRRAVAESVANVEFRHADAQVHAFDTAAFDLAISRFGVMFFNDRRAAFANIASALRPGGRLAMLAWQDMAKNEWIVAVRESLAAGRDLPMPPPGAPGPAALADPDDVRGLLTGAGFRDVELTSIDEPIWFGSDADAAYEFVGDIGIVKGLSDGLDPAARRGGHERLKAALRSHETPAGVRFTAAVWQITAERS